jgi:hypothetical protein
MVCAHIGDNAPVCRNAHPQREKDIVWYSLHLPSFLSFQDACLLPRSL